MIASPYPWQSSQWLRFTEQLHQRRLAHAYLLTGEPGLGKKDFAIAAAQILLCENPETENACNRCRSCELFSAGTNPDLLIIEPEDNQVIKIAQIRALSKFADRTSHGGIRKVVVVEQAEAMNVNAANGLLKTLEEPATNMILLLISSNSGRLLATIVSRCQRIPFPLPKLALATDWLRTRIDGLTEAKSLLRISHGRPLVALELHTNDGETEQRNISAALVEIFNGRLDPVEFSGHGRTIGIEKILEQLWYLTTECIKGILLAQWDSEGDIQLQSILQNLVSSSLSRDELLTRLLSVNASVDEAHKQLTGNSNPNGQLILEGILWRWSRLNH